MRRKQILFGVLAAPPLGLLAVALSFPFLAVEDPSGAPVAVVEGWIPEEHLPEVARVIDSLRYEHVYVTGTMRPCSYTLRIGDTLVVDLQNSVRGSLELVACGSNGAGFVVMDEQVIIMEDRVADACHPFRKTLQHAVGQLRITPTFNGIPKREWELVYIASVTVNNENLHALQRNTAIHRQEGIVTDGTPTYADVAVGGLRKAGMSPDRIITLRTLDAGESRTWANAKLFALRATRDHVDSVDVISLGIHARRSRVTYQTACGKGIHVGVISIADPEVARGQWWRTWRGWVKVTRELAGVPASYLVDRVK